MTAEKIHFEIFEKNIKKSYQFITDTICLKLGHDGEGNFTHNIPEHQHQPILKTGRSSP